MTRVSDNPEKLRQEIARIKVKLLEARQAVENHDTIIRNLMAENHSLLRDLNEWRRLANVRAERIVELETGGTAWREPLSSQ